MDLLNKLIEAKRRNAFSKYIDYIRFPKYKNFVKDTKLSFDIPITVFVGKNGSGKSSIIKALYGCIETKSLGDYWFSTKVDPIEEGNGGRNRIIYNYPSPSTESEFEVLLQRAPRKDNPDYWETSRPVQMYGMKKHPSDSNYRKSKLENTCLYIDFHSVLSAFDKYRYFLQRSSIIESNKYLRRKSNNLHRSLTSTHPQSFKGKEQNKLPLIFSDDELKTISLILDKKYTSGKIIKHKFFKLWGNSIIFETNNLKYSEAFAGSGETAVAVLVHELFKAKNGSLVLLDEPEVCLHPGAQKRLLDFLLEMSLKKQLQIVISTHSPEFVKPLPNESIKLFNELPDGSIEVINSCSYLSAFHYLGTDIETKKTIIVEDVLAKYIIDSIAKDMGADIVAQLNVIVHPGGHTSIKKAMAQYSQLNEQNKFIVFDGDQIKDHVDINTLPICDLSKDNLKSLISIQTGLNVDFFSKNSNETDDIVVERYKEYLTYYREHVNYLPLSIPEEIIWDDDKMKYLIEDSGSTDTINAEDKYKEKFRLLSLYTKEEDNAESIFEIQKAFVVSWKRRRDANYNIIVEIINIVLS